MDYDYSDLMEMSRRWVEQASMSGWIKADAAMQLAQLEQGTPSALFEPGHSRPLLVAFMGGTGVGKSSLLNRLAGAPIAKTGIVRPTSREVTLYHHQRVAIRHLPEKLPIESVSIAHHQDDSKKSIIWIDMPDVDSIEQANKHLVLQWLPHIDVLIYVVSPERYKDDKAWRLLLAEGGKHAWLFALNQWDLGRSEQYEDFKRQLAKAGFDEPIIFKTVCGNEKQADDFDKLASTITELANEHIVGQLEHRGLQLRKTELKRHLEQYRQALGSEILWRQTLSAWREQWQRTTHTLQQGFVLPLTQAANRYAEQAGHLSANPGIGKYPSKLTEPVWDAWAQSRVDDALDEFAAYSDHLGLPVAPVRHQLSALRDKAAKIIETQTELAARKALANPGNALQRTVLKCVRFAEVVLPLAAIGWVSYQIFTGYYHSNQVNADYLGVDFAVHSAMLIAISWLTPWAILKKIKPSLVSSALRGLNQGLEIGLSLIDSEVVSALEDVRRQFDLQYRQLSILIDQCGVLAAGPSERIDSKSPLNRMLIR